MLSDLLKSAFKMASKDHKKILLKSSKNIKLSGFFRLKLELTPWSHACSDLDLAISQALTINPTNFLRPPSDSQFFLSFNFYFGHKTPGGLKTWENYA